LRDLNPFSQPLRSIRSLIQAGSYREESSTQTVTENFRKTLAGLKGRDILSLVEFSSREIELILKRSSTLARQRRIPQQLKSKTVALIFQKPSTRTRVSFERRRPAGRPPDLSQLERNATGKRRNDFGHCQSLRQVRQRDNARVYSHDDLVLLADNADAPVINGLSDKHHPCQILADLLTLIQYKKRLKGLKLAYVGDGNNVCNSLLIGCAKTGVNIAVARPQGYGPDPEAIKHAEEAARTSGATISIVKTLKKL